MRSLIVCCDGTWNQPDHGKPTNVVKLALALAPPADEPWEERSQRVHYESGIGTRPGERLLGGAFGYGISRNIRDCYRFLIENYEVGDRIFLFGFSRGAYTARSLAGLIRNCGVLRRDCIGQVDAAYSFYRDRSERTHPRSIASRLFREEHSHADSAVHFIGVWDTVGSLGIPEKFPGWGLLAKVLTGWRRSWGFHDTQLSSEVTYAYQALAIDEQRPMYEPTLWTSEEPSWPPPNQTVEQVWFAGVHSAVGGGTASSALSDLALLWMAGKAQAADPPLSFRDGWEDGVPDLEIEPLSPDHAGPLVQSRRGFWGLLRPLNRLRSDPIRHDLRSQEVAGSAAQRRKERIEDYDPPGLDWYLEHTPIVAESMTDLRIGRAQR